MEDRSEQGNRGHRQRLRDRFLAGDQSGRTDEALLELLLFYAIPLKDVQPLAKALLAKFGSLNGVLAADVDSLCRCDGVKSNTATLLKLVDFIKHPDARQQLSPQTPLQLDLIADDPHAVDEPDVDAVPDQSAGPVEGKPAPRSATGMFGKSMLREGIELLPRLPDTESLDDIRGFLRSNLHFNSLETRIRNAQFIIRRSFPDGFADLALRSFAREFAGRQELRDVCFYRFCKSEALMRDVFIDVILPALGVGQLSRSRLVDYLQDRFPNSRSSKECAGAIADAMAAGGIGRVTRSCVSFSYREVALASFAFVLHSEFPEPGMYDLSLLENNAAMLPLLWNPDRILPAIYELRNRGVLAKVSEIDSVRQFTTKWALDQLVTAITSEGCLS